MHVRTLSTLAPALSGLVLGCTLESSSTGDFADDGPTTAPEVTQTVDPGWLSRTPVPCAETTDGQPYCRLAGRSDPDGDGRGSEEGRECIVVGSAADPDPGGCQLAGEGPSRIEYEGQQLYLSGFNVAWLRFARDFGGGFSSNDLRRALRDLVSAGGNTLRWWMHTDGSLTPSWVEIDGEALVSGPGGTLVGDLRRALDIADEYGAYVVPSLWSFDMLRDNPARNPPNADNYRLLTDDAVLQSYLDNVIVPLVQELNGHPALVAWELFNEPENMTESWFREEDRFYGGAVPTLEQLVRVQAKMAAAIHRAAMDVGEVALVTTGSKSMGKYNSDAAGRRNLYRDDRMMAAADGDPLATLDFYQPHYYDNEGRDGAWSPFHHPASYWQVDKPIVIGEFHSHEELDVLGESLAGEQMCQRLVVFGYAGGWPWQWNERSRPIMNCLSGVVLP